MTTFFPANTVAPKAVPSSPSLLNSACSSWGPQGLFAFGVQEIISVIDPHSLQLVQTLELPGGGAQNPTDPPSHSSQAVLPQAATVTAVGWSWDCLPHEQPHTARSTPVRLAAGDALGRVVVWDIQLAVPNTVCAVGAGAGAVAALAWLADGGAVVARHLGAVLAAYDARSGARLWRWEHDAALASVALDLRARRMLAGTAAGSFVSFEGFDATAAPGKTAARFRLEATAVAGGAGPAEPAPPAAFHLSEDPDGPTAPAPLSALSSALLGMDPGDASLVAIQFWPHETRGGRFAVILFTRRVMVFDLEVSQVVGTSVLDAGRASLVGCTALSPHHEGCENGGGAVSLVCLHADGSLSAWAGERKGLALEMRCYHDHTRVAGKLSRAAGRAVAVSCDPFSARSVLAVGTDGRVMHWEVADQPGGGLAFELRGVLEGLAARVAVVSVSPFFAGPGECLVALGTEAGVVQIADLVTSSVRREFAALDSAVRGLAWLGRGDVALWGHTETRAGVFRNRVERLHVDTGFQQPLRKSALEISTLRAVTFSHRRQYMAVAVQGRPFELWDLLSSPGGPSLLRIFREFPGNPGLVWMGPVESAMGRPPGSSFFGREDSVLPVREVLLVSLQDGSLRNVAVLRGEATIAAGDAAAKDQSDAAALFDLQDRPSHGGGAGGDQPGDFSLYASISPAAAAGSGPAAPASSLSSSSYAGGGPAGSAPAAPPSSSTASLVTEGGRPHSIGGVISAVTAASMIGSQRGGSLIQHPGSLSPPPAVTALAWKDSVLATGDGAGTLVYRDFRAGAGAVKVLAHHRQGGAVRKLCFTRMLDDHHLLALFESGDFGVWNVRGERRVALRPAAPGRPRSRTADVEWGSFYDIVTVSGTGTVRVNYVLLTRPNSAFTERKVASPMWCPSLLPPLHQLRLKLALVQPGIEGTVPAREPGAGAGPGRDRTATDQSVSATSAAERSCYGVMPPGPGVDEYDLDLMRQLGGASAVTGATIPERCYSAAAVFGSSQERSFWSKARAAIKDASEREALKGSGVAVVPVGSSSATTPSPSVAAAGVAPAGSAAYPASSTATVDRERQIVDLQAANHAPSRVIAHSRVLLGQPEKAIETLLENASIGSETFYRDALKACIIASGVSHEFFSDTVKVVATYFLSAGDLDQGVELLVATGRAGEACRYLQAHERWEEAAMLARTRAVPEPAFASIFKQWTDHLVRRRDHQQAIDVSLESRAWTSTLDILMGEGLNDMAWFLLASLREANLADAIPGKTAEALADKFQSLKARTFDS